MKKIILTVSVIIGLAGAGLQTVRAGEREWATVGKVLTGAAVAGVIAGAFDVHAEYNVSYSSPVYYPPPAPCGYYYPAPRVVYYPAPVVVYRAPVVVYARPHIHRYYY